MKKQIVHISIHQSSKVLALLYFVIFALFAIPYGLFIGFATHDWVNAATIFILPFVGLLIYYIVIAILLWIYNQLAKAVGGIEFTLNDSPK